MVSKTEILMGGSRRGSISTVFMCVILYGLRNAVQWRRTERFHDKDEGSVPALWPERALGFCRMCLFAQFRGFWCAATPLILRQIDFGLSINFLV